MNHEQVHCIHGQHPPSVPLYTPAWHIGTTAQLAMRESYGKQHTSPYTFHGL